MSDKRLFVLEQGLWDASKVIGAFVSLERAEARIRDFVAETVASRRDAKTVVYTCPLDAAKWFPEWFRVTVVEACWE